MEKSRIIQGLMRINEMSVEEYELQEYINKQIKS